MADNSPTVRNISLPEMVRILHLVKTEHQWPGHGRSIKYVGMQFDNRTNSIFTIEFRNTRVGDIVFSSANRQNVAEGASLAEEVIEWLNQGFERFT